MPKKMRAVQVPAPKANFEVIERDIPEPVRGEVRMKIQACGLCHSDMLTKEGVWPGVTYPRIPGHEVAGVIDAIGPDVPPVWSVGDRIGVGWYAGHCGYCNSCRRGDVVTCERGQITGITRDGGYADYVCVRF